MHAEYKASALFTWPGSVPLVLGSIDSPALQARLMPFFKGEKGDPGGMTTEEVQAQIAQGVSALAYDYDALLAANLSI